ncbi:MAG: hypothetical protein MZU79_05715 [Anaerotruncus sp.]|nr:hypothetical protein [Anaerotruncus sp.]
MIKTVCWRHCCLCKAAQYYRNQGQSLLDVLEKLYETHGYYLEGVKNIAFTGLDGMDKMKEIMAGLRVKDRLPPSADRAVQYTENYLSRKRTACRQARHRILTLPAADAVKLILARLIVDLYPSFRNGTEDQDITMRCVNPRREAAENSGQEISCRV